MSAELRDALRSLGEGVEVPPPDLADVSRRARATIWTRRVMSALGAIGVVLGLWLGIQGGIVERILERNSELRAARTPSISELPDATSLPPGTYSTKKFRVPLSVRVGAGWDSSVELPHVFSIATGNPYEPRSRAARPEIVFYATRVNDRPGRVVKDIRSTEDLRTTSPVETQVGEHTVLRFEAQPAANVDFGKTIAALWGSNRQFIEARWVTVGQDHRVLFTLLRAHERTLIVAFIAPNDRFDRFSVLADQVLATVTFES